MTVTFKNPYFTMHQLSKWEKQGIRIRPKSLTAFLIFAPSSVTTIFFFNFRSHLTQHVDVFQSHPYDTTRISLFCSEFYNDDFKKILAGVDDRQNCSNTRIFIVTNAFIQEFTGTTFCSSKKKTLLTSFSHLFFGCCCKILCYYRLIFMVI